MKHLFPFIYKRPDHTLKIIEKINQVKINKVYIIADGCKNETDRRDVEETRNKLQKLKQKLKIFLIKMLVSEKCEARFKKVFYFEKRQLS